MCNHQINDFTVNKDERNTKEDTEEYCGMQKDTSRAAATSNSEKIRSIA